MNWLQALGLAELEGLARDWPVFSLPAQRPPLSRWRTWLLLGGRGAGKTRMGAQWLKGIVSGDPHYAGDAAGRVALVGETYADARTVMIEGESGLLAAHSRSERPVWISGKRELVWPSGVIGQVFSANDPEGLRGSQFGAAWCDEIAKWAHPQETWDMLQFCMRLGSDPRQVATTTPKPLKLFARLMEEPTTAVTRSPTSANVTNLAPGFVEYLRGLYADTRLGRQELDGEIIEDVDGAMWQRGWIEMHRSLDTPPLQRIVVAVDPPASSTASSDACGIVAAGIDADGICHVLADRTVQPATPYRWAVEAVALYERLEADAIVAEINQGGDMVSAVVRQVSSNVPIRTVRATRGKAVRAEPVATLYERGRVVHAGRFPDLEDQMCAFTREGLADGRSPDRVDALVWAITDLALTARGSPRIRMIAKD
ncbi:MAG: terminase family protein [Nitratireductor sp.]